MPTFGLPLVCPKCPPRRYFGVLKGEHHPTTTIRVSRADVCPNCDTLLVDRRPLGGDARRP